MPVKGKRRVNDWVFTLLFIIIVPLVVVSTIFYAYLNQDVRTFIMPRNSRGEICGRGVPNSNKPHLLFIDYTKIKFFHVFMSVFVSKGTFIAANSKCIEECPVYLGIPSVTEHICEEGIIIFNDTDLSEMIKEEKCASFNIPTVEVFNYCIPDATKLVSFDISIFNGKSLIELSNLLKFLEGISKSLTLLNTYNRITSDFKKIEKYIPYYILMSLFITFIVVIIFGFGCYPIIICFYVVVLVLSLTSTVLTSIMYFQFKFDNFTDSLIEPIQDKIEHFFKENVNTFNLVAAITFSIVSIILLLLGCFVLPAINKACLCAKAAMRPWFSNFLMVVFPIVFAILQIAIILLWGLVVICLLSCDKKTYRFLSFENNEISLGETCVLDETTTPTLKCIFSGSYTPNPILLLIILYTFMTIWLIFCFKGAEEFLTAYISYRCFKRRTSLIQFIMMIPKGFVNLILYSWGSIVFGSFLIVVLTASIVGFEIGIRMLGINQNDKIVYLTGWIRKILISIREFFKGLNRRAYIYVAISGDNFCTSMRKIILIFVAHPLTTIVIEFYNKVILILGTVMVVVATSGLSYLHVKTVVTDLESHIFYPLTISFIGLVFSFSFFHVLTTRINVVHYIACYYANNTDGDLELPYGMTDDLQKAYDII